MSYSRTTWVNNQSPAINAANLNNIESGIVGIDNLIPIEADAANKLADKNFVNSSVASQTGHYISNNGQPFTSVAELEAYTGAVEDNDYAFVTGTESGTVYYDRYKARVVETTTTWAKEYRLNNSSFTADQWATINSGMSAELVASIRTHLNAINNPHQVTATQIGLGKVDNTSDKEKIVSDPTAAAIKAVSDNVYNKSDMNTLLSAKQDTLVAGENINITNSTIKAVMPPLYPA